MVLHQSATLVILSCFSSSRLVIQWRASWTQVQSQQTILWQTSSVQYVSCTSANWMAEAHTASELRYKNYTGQGNTYFRWEHNLSYCLYAWRLDPHWVGTWVGSRIAAQRSVCEPWQKELEENWRSMRFALWIWDSGGLHRKAAWKWL